MLFRSLTVRAIVALTLLVGFYLFAIGLGLVLFAIPVALVVWGNRISPKLFLICWAAGGTLLWNVVPRLTTFEPPGPLLDEKEEPGLFAFIRDVAARMHQPMPSEVYLVPDVNAFVAHRGGLLGLGGTRYMGLGLGLMSVDNVSQFKATVAHEFGHFAGGDTKLGTLVFGTRNTMVRTLRNLGHGFLGSVFGFLFKHLYMRITQAISRQQELVADEWSVKLAGKNAHVSGLKVEALHGAGFGLFLRTEVNPLLGMGRAPNNVFEGYRRFTTSTVWKNVQPEIEKNMAAPSSDPFDSHPPLDERIAYAQGLTGGDFSMDERPATALLRDAAALEQKLSAFYVPASAKTLSWDELAQSYADDWREVATRVQARVPSLDARGAVEALRDEPARRALVEAALPVLTAYRMPDARQVLGSATRDQLRAYLGTLLAQTGCAWKTAPGEALLLEGRGETINLNEVLAEVLDGKRPVSDVRELLARHQLPDSARLAVSEEARKKETAPRVPLTVTEDGKKLRFVAPFEPLSFPRCCCVCLGEATQSVPTAFKIGGFMKSDQTATIPLAACAEHQGKTGKVLDVRGYDEKTGNITFDVGDHAWAELIKRTNA